MIALYVVACLVASPYTCTEPRPIGIAPEGTTIAGCNNMAPLIISQFPMPPKYKLKSYHCALMEDNKPKIDI